MRSSLITTHYKLPQVILSHSRTGIIRAMSTLLFPTLGHFPLAQSTPVDSTAKSESTSPCKQRELSGLSSKYCGLRERCGRLLDRINIPGLSRWQQKRGLHGGVFRCTSGQARIPPLSEPDSGPFDMGPAVGWEQFVLEEDEVERLKEWHEMTTEELLFSLANKASKLARNPISHFDVGAAGLGASGRIFLGINLEFPGLPLSQSVHAEQFLVANAIQHEERQLVCVACNVVPCGHCRQFLQEIRGAGTLQFLVDGKKEVETLSQLLPHRFGPHDLLEDDFPRLMEDQNNQLTLIPRQAAFLGSDDFAPHLYEMLESEAFDAAKASYAPYSKCPSGISLMTWNCNIYSGSYMESAAYNPSMPPLQAALVALVSQSGEDFSSIHHAVLVERQGCDVSQEDTVRFALAKIAPNCSLHVVHATSPHDHNTTSSTPPSLDVDKAEGPLSSTSVLLPQWNEGSGPLGDISVEATRLGAEPS